MGRHLTDAGCRASGPPVSGLQMDPASGKDGVWASEGAIRQRIARPERGKSGGVGVRAQGGAVVSVVLAESAASCTNVTITSPSAAAFLRVRPKPSGPG